jgi:two-component system response regulator PhcR
VRYRDHKILYVDDEAANLTSFKYCFEDRFDVVTAASAEEALEILASGPFALLLADQRMPLIGGAELCQLVRERYPDVVRVIVTAYSDVSAAVAAINAGQVSRYLFKPWREEQMAEVLRAGIEAHQLGVMTRELQSRLLQSEQQSTTTYLLGRVLHELANPAATVNSNVEWLSDSLTGLLRRELPAELSATLHELHVAARETATASRELVARIERFRRGDSPAAPASTDLKRAVVAALTIIEREIVARARLDTELAELAPVAAEASQVSQIVVNLIMNALEALDGEPTLAERRIGVRVFGDGDRAALEVEDNGAGIAPELLPRIFEPFVATRSEEVARGFSLAIVHEIVHALGGEIRVVSQPKKGARFTVRLPFAPGRGDG